MARQFTTFTLRTLLALIRYIILRCREQLPLLLSLLSAYLFRYAVTVTPRKLTTSVGASQQPRSAKEPDSQRARSLSFSLPPQPANLEKMTMRYGGRAGAGPANSLAAPDGPALTMTQYVLTTCRGEAAGLARVLVALEQGVRETGHLMRRGLRSACSHLEGVRPRGGDVDALDLAAASIFIRELSSVDEVSELVLSTHEGSYDFPASADVKTNAAPSRGFVVVIDPLDGQNNADSGSTVGTIFGIYERTSNWCAAEVASASDEANELATDGSTDGSTVASASVHGSSSSLRPASELVAAGYAIYGASTQLVISVGKGQGLHGFTFDSHGNFVLTRPHIRTPTKGKTFSVNVGLSGGWDARTAQYIGALSRASPPRTLRYIGTMAADVHRTLLYGGLFLYPASRGAPRGKLRLLFEAGPMSWLALQAGAEADDGEGASPLNAVPTSAHEKTPLFIGSRFDVEDYLRQVVHEPPAPELSP
jgi:fructose-1,6-bisphosphatase I